MFGTGRGLTQGDSASPTIFNIVVDAVDAVVQAVLEEACSLKEEQHGMGWAAGKRNLVFYADDGRIAGRDHDWVQDDLTVELAMFQRMGMETNLEKQGDGVYPRVHLVEVGGVGL